MPTSAMLKQGTKRCPSCSADLHFLNHAGILVVQDGVLSARCPSCSKTYQVVPSDPALRSKPEENLLAALRDASYFANPNTSSIKRYHLFGENKRPLCGSKMVLCSENGIDPSQVCEELRCKKPGCKSAWPAL